MVVICELCFDEFATNRDLERHLQRKIPCNVGDFRCTGCCRPFQTKKNLSEHISKNRCKGKSNALIAHEQAIEIERLRNQAQQQDQLMQMTNSVTAAAALSHVTNIGTQINNSITINIHNNTHVASLGEERLSHFSQQSDEEMLEKLNLSRCPKALGAWCALLRADEEHPENHNALLLTADSKEMACCRGGKWSWGDTEKTLLEISRTDMARLHTHLNRYDQNQRVQDFRNEYLVHDVMAKATSGMDLSLKPIMDAVALPIIELTQKFYSCTKEQDMSSEDRELHRQIAVLEEKLIEEQVDLEKRQAGQKSALLQMKRVLADRAKQTAVAVKQAAEPCA